MPSKSWMVTRQERTAIKGKIAYSPFVRHAPGDDRCTRRIRTTARQSVDSGRRGVIDRHRLYRYACRSNPHKFRRERWRRRQRLQTNQRGRSRSQTAQPSCPCPYWTASILISRLWKRGYGTRRAWPSRIPLGKLTLLTRNLALERASLQINALHRQEKRGHNNDREQRTEQDAHPKFPMRLFHFTCEISAIHSLERRIPPENP